MITIVVGDVTEYLQSKAHQIDKSAQLLTYCSGQTLEPGTYYTSLGDFPGYRTFIDVLDQADVIVYEPPVQWSDQDRKQFSYMKHWTEQCLFYFHSRKPVVGYSIEEVDNLIEILKLEDTRKSDDSQLWVVGGSNTKGVGVREDQRYGQIIADHMGLPVTFLARVQASIEWTADQILRSDIRTGDTVVWGLTPVTRFPFYDGSSVLHVSLSHYTQNPKFVDLVDIDQLSNLNTLLYRPITSINQVQNFCQKLGVNLIIAGLDPKCEYLPYVAKFKNYIHLSDRFGLETHDEFIDFGWDNVHAGVKTHKWYADQILLKMSLLDSNTVAS